MRSACVLLLAAAAVAEVAPRFQPPQVFEASLTFHLPYFNFSESPYVWADMRNGGAMRFSYYGGANTFVMNNRTQFNGTEFGNLWSIGPVEQTLSCLNQPLVAGFNYPFPALDLFARVNNADGTPVIATVRGQPVTVWTFNFTDPQPTADGRSEFSPPNDVSPGYMGSYVWYQHRDTAAPVRFHTIVGHGVVLASSHVDEYILDYNTFVVAESWPDDFFAPPVNMPCTAGISPFGPTRGVSVAEAKAAAKKHLKEYGKFMPTDFHAAFPEGHAHRRNIADLHADVHAEHLDGKRHNNHQSAWLHTSARYVAARNRFLTAKGMKYTVGLNNLAHLSHDQRLAMAGYRNLAATVTKEDAKGSGSWPLGPGLPDDSCEIHQLTGKSIPPAWDLLGKNLVLPAKDQGACGSCWTFGATGAIEGAVAKAKGDGKLPVSLSEQSLMDCTWKYGNNGCNGGTDFNAFSWFLQQNKGLVATAESYGPYHNHDGFCHFDISNNWTTSTESGTAVPGARVLRCVHINDQFNKTDPTVPPEVATRALNDVLANVGVPVSVAIQATLPDFYYYTGGYYFDSACYSNTASLDHQVLAVGYTTLPDGSRYTRIRNSWSTHWGEDGLVWIAQNSNDCGVATSGTYIEAVPMY